MIFVAVGTQKFPMDRLLRELDMLVARGELKEEIFAQAGRSAYRPQYYPAVDFLPREQFEAMIARCDLLLTHAGVGTILTGLRAGKPIVVFPRLAQYREHVDDHQMEIAQAFARLGYVMLCTKAEELGQTIKASRNYPFYAYAPQHHEVVKRINDFLDRL